MITVLSFFTKNGLLATGLTPKLDVREFDGTLIVNQATMIELSAGVYKYEFSGDETKDYLTISDGGATLAVTERYKFGGTETTELQNNIKDILRVEFGRWKISNNKMTFYKEDGISILHEFNLKDQAGNPNSLNVFERTPV